MERGCNEKRIKKQILRAREHPTKEFLERKNFQAEINV